MGLRMKSTPGLTPIPRRYGLYLIDLVYADDSHGSVLNAGLASDDDLENTALAHGMDSFSLLRFGQVLGRKLSDAASLTFT